MRRVGFPIVSIVSVRSATIGMSPIRISSFWNHSACGVTLGWVAALIFMRRLQGAPCERSIRSGSMSPSSG